MQEEYIKGVEFSEDGKALVYFPRDYQGAYTIPDGVTEIRCFAFMDCTSLTEVWIPDSVTTIRYAAFDSCTSLTHVHLPAGPVEIDETAFLDCPVKIEKQVTRESMISLKAVAIAMYYTKEGEWLLDHGEPETAAKYFARALELKERVLGADHPRVLRLHRLMDEATSSQK